MDEQQYTRASDVYNTEYFTHNKYRDLFNT